jgi:branched-chain amino acid transport system permease protein
LIAIGDQPRTLPMFTDFPPLRLAGIAISYQFLWIFGSSALVITGLAWFFASTKTGKAMRACSINRDAANPGIAYARALFRAQRCAWRARGRTGDPDAIYRL